MMIAVAVMGIASWAFARCPRNWKYYAAGWWEAECELWRGEATVDGGGGFSVGDFCNIDEETGLRFRGGSGCVVHEGDRERDSGHNDHIAQYIRWHGPPRNTLKPWKRELFNLARYFNERSRSDVPKPLLAGGPELISPDARNSVRPIAAMRDDGTPSDALEMVFSAGNVVLRVWRVRWEKGESDLLWGPNGSRFVVVRSTSEKKEHYSAYALSDGWPLRSETWEIGTNGERKPIDLIGSVKFP
jgi:hypothetical protein